MLHFKSNIYELSGQLEFNFLPYESGNPLYTWTPFVYTGISLFHFNPKAENKNGEWVEPKDVEIINGKPKDQNGFDIETGKNAFSGPQGGETDLFYYRASSPAELVERQKNSWDPFLDWVNKSMNVRMNVSSGVMFIDQDDEEMLKLKAPIFDMTPFQLTGFHEIVTISGSLIGAYAFIEKAFTADQVWSASRLDEEWQIEHWGSDEEAMTTSEKKHHDFKIGCEFFQLSS